MLGKWRASNVAVDFFHIYSIALTPLLFRELYVGWDSESGAVLIVISPNTRA